ncbi:mucin-5AC-like [Anopheles coustani]|uniref:mucin-5AC-like n=1 Tax=Anopheles coustani TaxID=139045 RepID=UPI002659658B|nr:mucin-5AC-like [Anopheles coustani]
MYRHLSDDHPLKAMYCALKLECPTRSYIYVLENLGFDVPDSRLMVATYVNGDILLQSKMGDSQLLIVKRVKDTSLPKIVKVQGGIKMAEDGTILKATDTISPKRTSASSIFTGDRSSTKNAISGPTEAGGIATASINNTVNASRDRTVPSSSHATSTGTSNSPCLSEGRKLVPKQVNRAFATSVRKIIKLGNEPPSATSGNSGLVSITPEQTNLSQMSKTDPLSTAKLTIAGESTTAINTAVTETSTASVSANRTVPLVHHDAAQEVGHGFKPLGPIKPPQNIVKVKDFGFIKTSVAESKMTNTSHPCSSRNIVKLTRLGDGTLVIKLPSPSKPESQSVVGAPVERCASAHMDAAKTELTEGNKINAPPGVVRAAQSGIINASVSQQTLATKKQILPVKPLQAVLVTPVEQSVLNSNAAKSSEAKVIKSKAPTEVVRLVKSGIINTSSCVSSSKIVGSGIERSVPNSNTTKPTETGISKTKTPTGFMREVKSGKTVVGRSMEQSRPNTNAAKPSVIEVTNAKISAGIVRVVNSGIIHTSVAPATEKEHILTLNPPQNVNVLNANTAKSTDANKRKAPTGVVRVMETGINSISTSLSKNVVVTSMEQRPNSNATKPNSSGVNKARARSSSTAVNQDKHIGAQFRGAAKKKNKRNEWM